jgi:hypothetical protein
VALSSTYLQSAPGDKAQALIEARALGGSKNVPGATLYSGGRAGQLSYFKDRANRERLNADTDLKELRKRPEYQTLVKELESPDKP